MTGYVYAIQAGSDGPVKIGWSRHPEARLRDHQVSNAAHLRLVWTQRAEPSLESSLHAAFAEYRIRGEWFEPCALVELARLDMTVVPRPTAAERRAWVRQSRSTWRSPLPPAAKPAFVPDPRVTDADRAAARVLVTEVPVTWGAA